GPLGLLTPPGPDARWLNRSPDAPMDSRCRRCANHPAWECACCRRVRNPARLPLRVTRCATHLHCEDVQMVFSRAHAKQPSPLQPELLTRLRWAELVIPILASTRSPGGFPH